jgi:hypothetical protein
MLLHHFENLTPASCDPFGIRYGLADLRAGSDNLMT